MRALPRNRLNVWAGGRLSLKMGSAGLLETKNRAPKAEIDHLGSFEVEIGLAGSFEFLHRAKEPAKTKGPF